MIARSHVLLVLLAACSNDVALGGPNTLVRVDPESEGINCAQGGIAIHTGLDKDGDTYLDNEEIVSTQFVCNGTSPVECAGGTIAIGSVVIAAADELDELSGVNCVDGDVLIAGTDAFGIDLPDLEIVTGDLVIAGNAQLTSLEGLAGIRLVGGQLLVQGNDALADLGRVGRIEKTEAIRIVGNNSVPDLRTFSDVTQLSSNLVVSNNAALTSLAGLDGLTSAARSIEITANNHLTSAELPRLEDLGTLEISGNPELASIVIPVLQKVDFRMNVNQNAALVGVDLAKLATIGEASTFDGNAALESLVLPSVVSVHSFILRNNTALAVFEAPNLAFVTNTLAFSVSPSLRAVSAPHLLTIGKDLTIRQTGLANAAGLASVKSIGGVFHVEDNPAWRSFNGLGSLQVVSGSMIVTQNRLLDRFSGLQSLVEVGADLTITSNPVLPRPTAQAFAAGITVRGVTTIN